MKNEPASHCRVARLTRVGVVVAKASLKRAVVSGAVWTRSGVIYPWPG